MDGLYRSQRDGPPKSSGEVVPHSYSRELLGPDETCPLCGKDNQCRVAKGHPYKGLCWCDQIVVPGHILNRLVADWVGSACICRSCLETVARVSASLNDPDAVVMADSLERFNAAPGRLLFRRDWHDGLHRSLSFETRCLLWKWMPSLSLLDVSMHSDVF